MTHKNVTQKILTIAGYATGIGKEGRGKMFFSIKVSPLSALVAPNYMKEFKYFFLTAFC